MSIFFTLLFIGSLILNGILVWYIVKLLTKLFFIQENIEGLLALNQNFGDHLQQVNELEMYYGDETLTTLLIYVEMLSDLDVEENAEEAAEVQPEEEERE